MSRVGIVGLGPGAISAPDSIETWSIPWGSALTHDVYFEMHKDWRTILNEDNNYQDRLECLPLVYFIGEKPIANSDIYPLDEVTEMFGCYLESSIAYMLAKAILDGYKEIELYGISGDDKYTMQRPNLEYLIGFGRGKGLKISVQSESKLLTSEFESGRYGN